MTTDLSGAVTRPDLDGSGMKIGIVRSRFNQTVGDGLLSACLAQLRESGVAELDIVIKSVPGALEIPFMVNELALSGSFDGLIALGCIIRGETYHFEVVANESARCLSNIQIDTGVPLANAILTVENQEQAEQRMIIKGAESAQVAIEMVHELRSLGQL
ncbi:MAG: 6,7-dimethyl-8-ribityllumazine synthase [Pseudomonadota bacterium]|jgi:6,7-dimethyl-8-ribityllumazine synthase|nr:6,7-dimethyl-8-ribityllumazine synthase [Pseudomonadota bacterium]MED5510326.1 6,7-dimethyl-8-ribityllumazine synthase [Pseudomonadota bacterium]